MGNTYGPQSKSTHFLQLLPQRWLCASQVVPLLNKNTPHPHPPHVHPPLPHLLGARGDSLEIKVMECG